MARHFDPSQLMIATLGKGARKKLTRSERAEVKGFLMARVADRFSAWAAVTGPEEVSIEVASFSERSGGRRGRLAIAQVRVGPYEVEVALRKGRRRSAAWKIWDVRCGQTGVHLTRQYRAKFRVFMSKEGVRGLVSRVRGFAR